MKKTSILLAVMTLVLVGCSESAKKKSNSNAFANPLCAQYPWTQGCNSQTGGYSTGGYSGGYSTGGYSGGYSTGGYSGGYSTGGTTGTTTGTTTGGSTGGYTQIPSDNNWQSLYPKGVPTGTCSSPIGEGYDLRQGTVTLAGGMMYAPYNPWSTLGDSQYTSVNYTHNNSDYLVDVNKAKNFIATDSRLKVRFKVRPQPAVSKSQGTWCLGRQTGLAADSYGYDNLKFSVSLRSVNPDGSMGNFIGTKNVTAGVNSCTSVIDFTGLPQSNPNVVVVVHDVQSNQGCWYSQGCSAYVPVRSASCWQMDMQVSADGTKDFAP